MLLVAAAAAAGPAPPALAAEDALPVLARVGPWPVVSRLIPYRERLWFANSVKGVNHNSADLYSLGSGEAAPRYERHLFSQDAGQPAVVGGLLYWPYEDPRFSVGWAEIAVTDGAAWRSFPLAGHRAFHAHAVAGEGARLVAAVSAWRAGLMESADGGRSWRLLYDHPTAARRVSRIVDLQGAGGRVYGQVIDRSSNPARRRLLMLDGQQVSEVPGWPRERVLQAMAEHRGRLVGALAEAEGTAIWASDGDSSRRLAPPRAAWQVRDLESLGDELWALVAEATSGSLWSSADGAEWQKRFTLSGGAPADLVFRGARPYVGGAGDDGRGILWGLPLVAAEPVLAPPPALPAPLGSGALANSAGDWEAAGRQLDALLADPASYRDYRPRLRDPIHTALVAGPPPGWLAARLTTPMPEAPVSLIGGAVVVPAASLGRWLLFWAMARSGSGAVPLADLTRPWQMPPNRAEKYFATQLAAWRAAAAVGQDDAQTLAALIAALEREREPAWLGGDIIGALSALSGERFGYDREAWLSWWRAR
jgi:hypothetical protein